MKIKLNLYLLFLRLFYSFIFFFITSLFFSQQKIFIILVIAILFCFSKVHFQKILVINLLVLAFFLKLILYPFEKENSDIKPYKATIYEKHFLYGIKNLNISNNIYNGDLSSLNKNLKMIYFKKKPRKVKIITDNLGFRNELKIEDINYILVGDSFLHSTNLTQENILNYILFKKFKYKTYNAGLGATDISHYLETIKFFKEKKKYNDKKFIMFIFQGNDFLKYKINDNNTYNKYIDNKIFKNYFKFKTYMNFYHSFKYFLYQIKTSNNKFEKVRNFKINNKDVLFKFDYIYENDYEVNSLNNIFSRYDKYIPDLIIFIPTKYEVYCELIHKTKCISSNHFSVLKNDPALSSVKVLDSTNFLKKKAKLLLKNNDELLYEIDDTHLNKLGINALAKFLANYISKKNF